MTIFWRTVLLTLLLHVAGGAAFAQGKIRSFEPDSLGGIVAAQQGRPFVVMVWSLDCDYCEASFQALAQARRNKGLGVVTIATDRADDPEAVRLIMKKLVQSGLASEAWAFGAAPTEHLRYAIDPKWRGEMPRSYWFDGGRQIGAYSGMITSDLVAKIFPR